MKVIAVFTETGSTGRLISKHRPRRPIIAFSTIQETRRRISLYWGVVPRTISEVQNIEELVQAAEKRLLEEGSGPRGDIVGHRGRNTVLCGRHDKLHEISRDRQRDETAPAKPWIQQRRLRVRLIAGQPRIG